MLFRSFKDSYKYILFAFFLISILLLSIQLIHHWRDVPYEHLVRDPNAIAESPKYYGFISQFGIFLWFATVGICFLGYFLTRRTEISKAESNYLLYFGFFSLMLGMDDAYMLHEDLAHRGLFEEMFFVVYALMLLTFIFKFIKLFWKSEFILLLLSGVFLASSIIVDKIDHTLFLLDDSFKLSGIVFWFIYFSRTVYSYCLRILSFEKSVV